MPRKSVTKAKKAVRAEPTKSRIPRDRVITFPISPDEAALIAKAADRVPLARYSRDAVLVKATAEVKATK